MTQDEDKTLKPLSDAALDKLSRLVDKKLGPIDATATLDPVLAALNNAASFKMSRHRIWLGTRCAAIQKTARAYPPNRIYKTKEWPDDYFVIKGYAKDGHAIVTKLVMGGALTDVHVDPAELTDVTDELKAKYGLS